jgi:hypothetical protein
MTHARLLAPSLRLYSALILLYPADLRRDFGADMLDVFADDLITAIQFRGLRGAIATWRSAFRELTRIALPALFENPLVTAPCVLFAFNEFMMIAAMLAAIGRRAAFGLHTHDLLAVLFNTPPWPALAAATTAIAVVLKARRPAYYPLVIGSSVPCSKSAA